MFIGFIIGIGAGLWLSTVFIFPADVLSLKLAAITIGDILRIFGGLVVAVIGGIIGGNIGAWIDDSERERASREKYGYEKDKKKE